MSTVTVLCPKCSMELEAPDSLIGKPATCPRCASQFLVSASNAIPSAAKPAVNEEDSDSWSPSSAPVTAGDPSRLPPAAAKPAATDVPEPKQPENPSGRLLAAGEEGSGTAKPRKAKFKGLVGGDADLKSAEPASPVPSAEPLANAAEAPTQEPPGKEKEKPSRSKRDKIRKASSLQRQGQVRKAKSAKIVTGAVTESNLRLGEDGTLPHLHVKELERKESRSESSSDSNPLVLIAVLGVSVILSITLLFVPSGSSIDSDLNLEEALGHLSEHYIGKEPQFAEYEQLLRQALQEENKGDRRAAKRIYRRVLDMVHQEGRDNMGISGPDYATVPPNDTDLEEHLTFLIATGN